MQKSRVVEYDWYESGVAVIKYDDGRVVQSYKPLPVPKRHELRDSYYANLMLWIRLEHGQ